MCLIDKLLLPKRLLWTLLFLEGKYFTISGSSFGRNINALLTCTKNNLISWKNSAFLDQNHILGLQGNTFRQNQTICDMGKNDKILLVDFVNISDCLI